MPRPNFIHRFDCRCRTCAPPPLGHSQRTTLALIYAPGLIAAAALFFLLVTR